MENIFVYLLTLAESKEYRVTGERIPITKYITASEKEEEEIKACRKFSSDEIAIKGIEMAYPSNGQINILENSIEYEQKTAFSGHGNIQLNNYNLSEPICIVGEKYTKIKILTENKNNVLKILEGKSILEIIEEAITVGKRLNSNVKENYIFLCRSYESLCKGCKEKELDKYLDKYFIEIRVGLEKNNKPYLFIREVVKPGEKEYICDTRKPETCELYFLDSALVLKPENIQNMARSLDSVIELLINQKKNPIIHKETAEPILGLLRTLKSVSKVEESRPNIELFFKNIEQDLPYYPIHFEKAIGIRQ